MNRWQHFYDLAAAQLAVTYAQTRNFDVAEKVAAAKRMAADAKAFADAFKAAEEAAFEPAEEDRSSFFPAPTEPATFVGPNPNSRVFDPAVSLIGDSAHLGGFTDPNR
jgi:hypothetical protein